MRVVDMFNDPKQQIHALLMGSKLGGVSINLHKACTKMVFMDIPGSIPVAFQAGGRIVRLGQTCATQIYLLTQDHTFDQAQQFRMVDKYLRQASGESQAAVLQDSGMVKELERKIQYMFGMIESRWQDEWGDKDLLAKDRARAEREKKAKEAEEAGAAAAESASDSEGVVQLGKGRGGTFDTTVANEPNVGVAGQQVYTPKGRKSTQPGGSSGSATPSGASRERAVSRFCRIYSSRVPC